MKNILALLLGTKPKLESMVGHELFWQFFGKPSNPYSGYYVTALRIKSAVVRQIN